MNKKIIAISLALLMLTGCAGGIGGLAHRIFDKQIEESTLAPVLMGQGFVVRSNRQQVALQDQWVVLVELLKQEPGFISATLNKGENASPLHLSLIEWESAQSLKKALAKETIKNQLKSMRAPRFHHLFEPGADRLAH